jgi:type I restriction enzyme S subunit
MTWPKVKIYDVCVPTSQRDPRLEINNSFRYIDISSIIRETKEIGETTEIFGADAPSRARKEVFSNDVLISTVRPNLNAIAIVPEILDKQIASTGFTVLRANNKLTISKYLFYWAQTPTFINYMVSLMKGASYPAVSDKIVKDSILPLPTITEQHRIVEILDQADALRKKRAEADKLSEKIIPALFYKMFGDPLSNPMNWNMLQVGDVVEEPQFGVSVALSGKTIKVDGSLPILRIANITNDGYLDVDDLRYDVVSKNMSERLKLLKNDLLFNWRNSPNLVGKTAIFKEEGEYIFASFLFRLRTINEKVNTVYLWFFLNYLRRKQWFEMKCRQAVSQANFGRDELCAIDIPIPPIEKQDQFAEYVNAIEDFRSQNHKASDNLDGLYKALLFRAFSGDLTAKWREAHMKALLQEMEQQAKELSL